jgi:excisionase family DNA binding protein
MTVEELAAKLGIGRNQCYDAVRAGQFPVLRVGRRWLLPRAAINKMLSGETRTQPAIA